MLQLKNITKRYEAGEFSVDALKGVSLSFRTSEFVSILGPSGCGKTTMLNIVGGLDKYTSGDLVINGKSTKNFTDRDWDAYRNHSVGFVFQSYNLIPHQTILQNVELALALSGVKKAERVARAKEALDKVGLANMYNKRPSEMSGGQMQRVAIARAIVNNPDIILADEPTGALDTETSLQVMDILKEISKDRLVVMVTHNPELAEKYSTRIVRMLDGLLVDDSAPLSEEELQSEEERDKQLVAKQQESKAKCKKEKKPKMSFATSFMLSLKNLFTKRGRTMLTSFAGSIGIIGIALIFAVSQGTTNYIAAVQEDTLASYPLTITQINTDMSSMFLSFVNSAQSSTPHEKDAVYEKMALYSLTNSLANIEQKENDLAAYKKHLDEQMQNPESELNKSLNGVRYSYNLDLLIYTQYSDGETTDKVMLADTSDIMKEMVSLLYGVDMSQMSLTGGGLMSMLYQSGSAMSMW
ncbi:MAG: ABC transporter ATP-binding protein, partial [Candidatus Fimimonas sp.]